MIGHRERQLGVAHRKTAFGQHPERWRPREIVHEVAVDVQEIEAASEVGHDVRVPDLLDDRARSHLFLLRFR